MTRDDPDVVATWRWTVAAPPGADYPGRAELAADVDQLCLDAFVDYVGESVEASGLRINSAEPLRARWEELDDRQILCALAGSTGSLTGLDAGPARSSRPTSRRGRPKIGASSAYSLSKADCSPAVNGTPGDERATCGRAT
jgi:hypothetical protein